MNSPVAIKEVQFVILQHPQKKSIDPGDFTVEFCQMFKGDLTPILRDFFQKIEVGVGGHFPVHFMEQLVY